MIRKATLVAFLAIALCSGAHAGALEGSTDTVVSLPQYGFLGGFDVTPGGSFLVHDGYSIREIDRAGANMRTLFTYTEEYGVWGSFVKYNAGRVYFGESMNGNINSCDYADPSDAALLTHLTNNFDMAFRGGKPYVPATAADYSSTSIYLLDGGTKDVIVDQAPGPSGPVAFDGAGNLYYALGDAASSLYRWSAEEVQSAVGTGKLTAGPSNKIADMSGPYGFAVDSRGYLFYTTNWTAGSQIGYRAPDGSFGKRAGFDIAGLSAQYGGDPLFKEITGAYLTALTYDASRESLSAAASYTAVYWTDETHTDTTRVPYTVISTLSVPEPSSLLCLMGFFGVAAARLRRRSV